MAYRRSMSNMDGDQTTGWGLIYRLNNLFSKIEWAVEAGDMRKWNTLLDRIFCNLAFEEQMDVKRDDKDNIISVEMSEKDKAIFNYLTKEVKNAFDEMSLARRQGDIKKARIANSNIYRALIKKDVFLRKYMHSELKMYLKKIDSNPGRAIYGG
jgi:hypothetical protein